MSRFIQIHTLTSYPPANLNRDDLGRPKTAMMGGVERLRVSSQSLKRHWRTSDLFQEALGSHLGTRTKGIGEKVQGKLLELGTTEKQAQEWAADIASVFGKIDPSKLKEGKVQTRQMVFITPEEWNSVFSLVDVIATEKRKPNPDELSLLVKKTSGVDIALFGRMMTTDTTNIDYSIEAACQVAHAISVHGITVEDDYFTAVDDLNADQDDRSAAHLDETSFAAALFYGYVCIDRDALLDNLNGDKALANKAIAAMVEAIARVSPKGKQNSFGSHAYASYMMLERGRQQPRSLSAAFLTPIKDDYLPNAIKALEQQVEHFDRVYGECAEVRNSFNAVSGEGSLKSLVELATQD